jgi:hypothetical protein
MLIRNWQDQILLEVDATEGTTTDTQPTKTGQSVEEKLFTQAEIDKLVGSTRKAARETGKKELLEELGIDSLDTLKNFLKAQKEKEESEKTEAQKALDKLAEMQKQLETERQARVEAEKLRFIEKRDGVLRALLATAHDPDGVLILLKAKHADKVEALLGESGDVDSKEAEKLVSEYRAANAYQFKADSKGSPSNADGRLLKPIESVREEVRKEIKQKFNF